MDIIEIHVEGGIIYMGTLFILFVSVIITAAFALMHKADTVKAVKWLKITQELALFALVFGILSQVIGLLGAFQAIESAGEISQGLLVAGLGISSYTTVYGLVIFLLARIFKIGYRLAKP